jgi:hypothetical protein
VAGRKPVALKRPEDRKRRLELKGNCKEGVASKETIKYIK